MAEIGRLRQARFALRSRVSLAGAATSIIFVATNTYLPHQVFVATKVKSIFLSR